MAELTWWQILLIVLGIILVLISFLYLWKSTGSGVPEYYVKKSVQDIVTEVKDENNPGQTVWVCSNEYTIRNRNTGQTFTRQVPAGTPWSQAVGNVLTTDFGEPRVEALDFRLTDGPRLLATKRNS